MVHPGSYKVLKQPGLKDVSFREKHTDVEDIRKLVVSGTPGNCCLRPVFVGIIAVCFLSGSVFAFLAVFYGTKTTDYVNNNSNNSNSCIKVNCSTLLQAEDALDIALKPLYRFGDECCVPLQQVTYMWINIEKVCS